MSKSNEGLRPPQLTRRQFVKTVVIGGVATSVMMPQKWLKPIVDTVITPAHAAASGLVTTAATTSTTTTNGTTTTTTTPNGP